MSQESMKPSAAYNNSLHPSLYHINTASKMQLKFDGSFVKQEKKFTHEKVGNIYIVYDINL